jgi:hypothetical protein
MNLLDSFPNARIYSCIPPGVMNIFKNRWRHLQSYSTCQHTSQLSQCITVVLQKHYCYFLALIKYLRALATSQMPLHIPHMHRQTSRYFTNLIRIYLFITVTHLLITPPISNSFYTGTINHIFQKCYALRFNSSSVHIDILMITLLSLTQLSQVPFYRVKVATSP